MKELLKNQKGYTLLEIILSISLLSIVSLIFFGFFIQANSATARSQTSMSAGQFSQEVLDKVRNSTYTSDLTTDNLKSLFNYPSQGGINSNGEFYIQVNNQKFYPVVKISSSPGPNQSYTNLYLMDIQIWVYQKGIKVLKFETYGYKGWS